MFCEHVLKEKRKNNKKLLGYFLICPTILILLSLSAEQSFIRTNFIWSTGDAHWHQAVFPETLFQVSTLGLMLEGHVMGRSSASFKHPLNCGNTLLQGSPLSFQVPHKHSRQHSKPPLLCQPAGKADRELLVSHSKSHQSRHTLKGGWAQFCLVFFFFFPFFLLL